MDIHVITVIGSGVMGRGIAYAAAAAGFEVRLHDKQESQLAHALETLKADMDTGIARGKLTPSDKEQALHRIKTTTELEEAARQADFVIEAIPEILDLKLQLFKALDSICPGHTILATNTSTMSPTEVGAATKRSGQTIAMHFFNPVPKMKLVEIIRGLDTTDATYAITRSVAEQMGKVTVEVNEFPGFITSRINCLVGNEAMRMLQEGVASASDIDKAVKLGLNHPMGPLELADLVGLDARLRNMQYLHEKLGETYRPAPILEKYVAAGRLGRKSGKGFYEYDS
ncbi:3-hydroxyacyl-CoA dehydrogenase [Fodinisporobacter ferrooxydans]|uniref:3-hydroxyacyl-CoA dehydrogenase n=1 Tax=Fodinisporobacter ferrooxydans TaxID=2901836 RepID=A0ABY4CGG3_9BACL|nr:3-hydroxyacyl-CoA dehydrogenase [Alicyclobacillaceae bacterium MYW30-H2]